MIDTNFDDMSQVDIYNEQTKTDKVDVVELMEQEVTKETWDDIKKLIIWQVKIGLEDAVKRGLYADQIVKTGLALLKQADKTFDADSAQELKDAFARFDRKSKNKLKGHKQTAINATMQ